MRITCEMFMGSKMYCASYKGKLCFDSNVSIAIGKVFELVKCFE